ncbi:pentatricopeptide repeat-containing protein At4g21065-like [Andrographis paniculata]|uniref:pentatricopeptide repeat-containing protein At4g21065-like n=1 Tax=Andrographis paniculata TaxID=175694 RepID=UPI0021E80A30|nr:pentatricopeptide repeat-containing protein At4g21065-like [Andrographis paniculata]XP_051113501.1 pentatricopeptide repeat-containing protein At4g21065-like [Andrographis paniculata]XP_051113502.1 pentatricopeptide repeat-containing protein At4g21065-like [Andrographis paniculata]XP_051113503.1 pentatricopeptide repeat-containing protein At4g21065-like [Andrographis paniculata]
MLCRHIEALLRLPKLSAALLSQLHCFLLKTPIDHHGYFSDRILSIDSSASASLHHARKLFDSSAIAPSPVFPWNTLIKAYLKSSAAVESVKLFVEFLRVYADLRPDNFTYPAVIKACGRCSMLGVGGSVHSMVFKAGFGLNSHVNNTLLTMYGDCGVVEFSRKVFDEMRERDLVSWSSMIAVYVDCKRDLEGLKIFKEMITVHVKPNFVTFVTLVASCTNLLNIQLGKAIHAYMLVYGVEFNVILGTALLNMYAKFGHLEEASCIFHSLSEKNLQSWTVMISCLAYCGRGEEALSLFKRMEVSGLRPDSMSFSAILSACSHGGLLDKGRELFKKMVNVYNINPTMEHYGCMVDLLGRAGKIDEAYHLIKSMPMKPNCVILRSYISACKRNSRALYADRYLMQLLLEIEPNLGSNHVLAASVSSVTGFWEDMDRMRHDMKRKGLKKGAGCSWI